MIYIVYNEYFVYNYVGFLYMDNLQKSTHFCKKEGIMI